MLSIPRSPAGSFPSSATSSRTPEPSSIRPLTPSPNTGPSSAVTDAAGSTRGARRLEEQAPYPAPDARARRTRRNWLVGAATLGVITAAVTLGVLAGTGHLGRAGAVSPTPAATPTATPSVPAEAEIVAADPLAWPHLDFTSDPSHTGWRAVALTFDDGPGEFNSTHHLHILDQLADFNLKATFLINGNASVDVLAEPSAQQAIRRTQAEGHTIGSHGVSHQHWPTLSRAALAADLQRNLDILRDPRVLGPGFELRYVRAPFGQPFQRNTADVSWVAPLTAPFGIHLGWGIDTKDYECAQRGQGPGCVVDRFVGQLNKGRGGLVLMHSLYAVTGDALPAMLQALWDRKYEIVTVDDIVQRAFGKNASEVMVRWQAQNYSPREVTASAMKACRLNNDLGTAP
jgi:peptidoglycan/xylan/chitin deacetylase (PgdA/CDA1 family)